LRVFRYVSLHSHLPDVEDGVMTGIPPRAAFACGPDITDGLGVKVLFPAFSWNYDTSISPAKRTTDVRSGACSTCCSGLSFSCNGDGYKCYLTCP
jgi:hypothetical protein